MVCAPSLGTLAGVVTPCSGMPARSPGRNWSTASGASLAPASWTRSSRTCSSAGEQGCRNAAQLYREVGARGFAGSYALVRSYLDAYRVRPDPAAPPPPTVRQVTGWLTRHPATLTEDDQVRLKAVLEQCPELRSAAGHVRAFGEMLTKLRGQELPAWIAAVRAEGLPGLTAFADSLTSDLDAVTRGLTTRWNSGPIEGRVNHIKMLKRQMFGRASLPLLRKRVLLTASR
jgi:transposase